ncbi:hypothetical protein [Hymenobacter negativus]|uniref:DUF4384 domain-containing protein n=1 Tax=Hymenobacter negativus TaxID=2795026 RepID=A0ABS3QCI8_9BACT|nr:hypothetical protein [Hymenobacter negativus]MBO2008902.1 hypothetical protein [Hymenobacter negativus]
MKYILALLCLSVLSTGQNFSPSRPSSDWRRPIQIPDTANIYCEGPSGWRVGEGYVVVRFFDGKKPIIAAPFATALPTPPRLSKNSQRDLHVTYPRYNFQFGTLVAISKSVIGANPSGVEPLAFSYTYKGQVMTIVVSTNADKDEYIDSIRFRPGVYRIWTSRRLSHAQEIDRVPPDMPKRPSYAGQFVTFHDYLDKHKFHLAENNPFGDCKCLNHAGIQKFHQPATHYIENHLSAYFQAHKVDSTTRKLYFTR